MRTAGIVFAKVIILSVVAVGQASATELENQQIVAETSVPSTFIPTDAGDRERRATTSVLRVAQNQDTPRGVLRAYRDAMEAGVSDPDLDIYSRKTREMLASWHVSSGQMAQVARSIRDCPIDAVRRQGGRAVIRSPASAGACPPYFFVREGGRWRLDLEPMQQAIRFGQDNAWRIDLSAVPAYRFAFRDWRFDERGFPIAE